MQRSFWSVPCLFNDFLDLHQYTDQVLKDAADDDDAAAADDDDDAGDLTTSSYHILW